MMKPILLILLSALLTFSVQAQESIVCTLHNTSAKSIPLWIPSVMNPNLSPFSKSGVDLRVGQKVFFKYDGKKEVLFVVSADQDNQTLDVVKLIKAREEELDQERKAKRAKGTKN